MAKKMLIDATHAEETRVVVADGNRVEEFDFEAASRRQLAGNIYLAKVTRVEPSLQAAFVEYGGNRHGFLAFSEIHPDYYQIPVADRKALLEEEREYARAEGEGGEGGGRRRRSRGEARAERAGDAAAVQATAELADAAMPPAIPGMDIVDLDDEPSVTGREAAEDGNGNGGEDGQRPYAAVDHAAEIDDQIESIADEDVSDEIRAPRRQRPRKYKIQEVIKVRQILLVQVVKEERGNKGAALTTYLSLAGRYCVLMPNTARGGGISRKITQAADRKKLKEIAGSLTVPEGAGLIIRTAGAKRTKAEIKRDYEYLQRLWDQIRDLTLKSIAPAPIYEEGNLIKRSIRDLYSREIEEVLVEGEAGYRVAKDFMKMIMPSHAKNVKHHTDPMPLFARYQVESYLNSMFNPVVQLKSGGYIVIGITEALVAIDVNSGRATKEGSIEETALKTNVEAAEEIARQLRLRDLAGLIVIDFIDMEERKNNAAVEKRLKDKLKTDRARIQVGRISGFGLLEMSRQRLRPGMLEATTQPCPHCHGTGLIRSDDNLALAVLRQIEEEGTRRRSREVLVRAPVGIVNFLMNQKREHVAQIESRYGMSVRIEADPAMISPDFSVERFKTAVRPLPAVAPVVSLDSSPMSDVEDEVEQDESPDIEEAGVVAAAAEPAEDGGGRRKRRRRRRRRGGSENGQAEAVQAGEAEQADDVGGSEDDADEAVTETAATEAGADAPDGTAEDAAPVARRPSRRRTGRSGRGRGAAEASEPEAGADTAEPVAEPAEAVPEAGPDAVPAAEAPEEAVAKPRRRRTRRPAVADAGSEAAPSDAAEGAADASAAAGGDQPAVAAEEEKPRRAPARRRRRAAAPGAAAAEPGVGSATETAEPPEAAEAAEIDVQAPPAEAPAPEPEPEQPAREEDAVETVSEQAEAEPAEPDRQADGGAASADDTPAAEETAEPGPDRPRRRGWWSLRG